MQRFVFFSFGLTIVSSALQVRILRNILRNHVEQERERAPRLLTEKEENSVILFWLDADAIFVRSSRRIEDIAQQHPRAHLILCEEGDGGMRANTGAMLMRATNSVGKQSEADWLSNFLEVWWKVGKERPELLFGGRHEQSALDFAIRKNADKNAAEEIAGKPEAQGFNGHDDVWKNAGESRGNYGSSVVILSAHAFNSQPPFYATTRASSFVIHAMFEPYGQLRERVFREFYTSVVQTALGKGVDWDAGQIAPLLCGWAEESYRGSMRQLEWGDDGFAGVVGKEKDAIEEVGEKDQSVKGVGAAGDADLCVMLAQCLEACHGIQEVEEANRLYEKAARIAPQDPDTHRLLGARALDNFRRYQIGDVCACKEHLKASRSLEKNPMRILELSRMDAACGLACAEVQEVYGAKHVSWRWIVGTAVCMSAVIVAPILCGLLNMVVKEKED